MSTTFAVKINHQLPDDYDYQDDSQDNYDENFIKVAFRSHYIRWINKLGHMLNDDIKVYPIDNSAQGIYTIGDIKKDIQNTKPF